MSAASSEALATAQNAVETSTWPCSCWPGERNHDHRGNRHQGAPVPPVELECRAQDLADSSRGQGGQSATLPDCLVHVRDLLWLRFVLRTWVAVPLALAAQLAGQREPDVGLGGSYLRSSQVLLDVEVGAPLRCADVRIQALGLHQRPMTLPHRLLPGQIVERGHVCSCSAVGELRACSSPATSMSRPALNRSSRLSTQTCSPRATRAGKRSRGRERKNWCSWALVDGSRTRCSLAEVGVLLTAKPMV